MALNRRPPPPTEEQLRRWIELTEEAALKEKIAHGRVLRNFLLTRDEMIADPGREWDDLAGYLRDLL